MVGTDRLIGCVWDGAAPATVVNTLQKHISYLRRLLGPDAPVLARHPGYLLDVDDGVVDLRVAEGLVRRGEQPIDPARRVRELSEALALWRGRPLANLAGLAWADEQAERLELRRLEITRELIEARLAVGEHALVLPELDRLAQEHRLDEEIHGQRMLALYRCGRQADALAVYAQLRRTLGDDLGVDPGKALRDLHRDILRQDPRLDLPGAPLTVASARAARWVGPGAGDAGQAGGTPAQLPMAVPTFTGRGRELSTLDALLPDPGVSGPSAVVISSVSGTAGVGKPDPRF